MGWAGTGGSWGEEEIRPSGAPPLMNLVAPSSRMVEALMEMMLLEQSCQRQTTWSSLQQLFLARRLEASRAVSGMGGVLHIRLANLRYSHLVWRGWVWRTLIQIRTSWHYPVTAQRQMI